MNILGYCLWHKYKLRKQDCDWYRYCEDCLKLQMYLSCIGMDFGWVDRGYAKKR